MVLHEVNILNNSQGGLIIRLQGTDIHFLVSLSNFSHNKNGSLDLLR